MRKFKYGCGVIGQNFLLNYSLFKITVNPSKKVEFSSEKQKDMSDDGTLETLILFYPSSINDLCLAPPSKKDLLIFLLI